MQLLCWLSGHRWFWTVITHHDVREPIFEDFPWRGEWKERICIRCQKNQAVFQEKLFDWDPVYEGKWRLQCFKDDEHFPLEGAW